MTAHASLRTVPGEHPGVRAAGIAASLAAHLIAIGAIVALTWRAFEPERPQEPVRLVFVEPAPPPRLGVPAGAGNDATSTAPHEPVALPEPKPLERTVTPPPVPKARQREIVRPQDHRRAVAPLPKAPEVTSPPAPAAPATAAPDQEASAGPAAPPGVAQGSAAGVDGGVAGGRVGGLGSELTPLARAAVPPRIVRSVLPTYPERARVRGIEGEVMIEAVIAADGSVEPGIRVVRSIPELDDAAIDAFRRWRFSPARDAQGHAIRVVLEAPVRFVLR